MTLHLLNLRSIKNLTLAEKTNLPVSITIMPDGTPMVVSRYGDKIWDFYPYIPQENVCSNNKQIDWRVRLPDGRLLSDSEHADLLMSTKDFIWSLFTDPVEGRKRPLMNTLRKKAMDIRPLLRWMVSLGVTRFADLRGQTLDYVPLAKLNTTGKPAAAETAADRLLVVEDLYHQRSKLHDALSEHPWLHETAGTLGGLNKGGIHSKPKTEYIPDAVASRLAVAALDYVQNRSVGILEALQAVGEAASKKAFVGFRSGAQCIASTATARIAGYNRCANLTTDCIRLRTACYIAVGMFSGIRDSEMMSVTVHCIAHGTSRDGSTDVQWLHGTLYKTGIRPKKWLVPPIVQEAVDVLVRLTASQREKLLHEEHDLEIRISRLSLATERGKLVKRLDTVRKQKDKLFLSQSRNPKAGEVSVISGSSLSRDLKQFCIDLGIQSDNGLPYPLHSHQFRRTYARFIARSELGDLLALRDHFGHWSIDMTVYYADGGADEYESDTELLKMIAEEKMGRQNEIMGSYLDSDAPLANGNHWLKNWRSTVRTATNKEALIAEYAGTITLTGTGHSWCVGIDRGTCCGGLCVFEPQMCVDCNHGIIGPEHRPVWEGIRDQQLEALALDDIGPSGRARAQKIIGEAEKVLRRLDGQEEA
jgi:integrase